MVRTMPSFKLPLNKKYQRITEALLEAKGDYVTINVENDRIVVSFEDGLVITRFDLGEIGKELTDKDWNALCREVKSSLTGAKVRDFNTELIGIHPLKTKFMGIRLTSIERKLIEEAARIEQTSLTDFVRVAALRVADQVIYEEKMRKLEQEEKGLEEKRRLYERSYLA
jgi:hypothetical protein